jgi:Amt family ammonium transporter
MTRRKFYLALFSLFLFSPLLQAQETIYSLQDHLDIVWVLVAGVLVFFMQAGFALLETGMSRAKNAVNVMMKNYTDVCMASVIFWLIGYSLMFGENTTGFYGFSGFGLEGDTAFDYVYLFFQAMFAATAATICSGAMAERTKYNSYILSAAVLIALVYPIYGSWVWIGAGFLWAFPVSFLVYFMISKVMGLRFDSLHEQRGLDVTEHAEIGFPEFQQNQTFKTGS